MSDDEFLARWSRRKREARAGNPPPQPPEPVQARGPPPGLAENSANQDVDLSTLPPIESIDASTDITAFLRKGIPGELSRAALRRAWAADPAIRDFVGLAENAWDFNDPNAMPGFGPLDYSAEQIDALVGRIVGGVRQATERLANSVAKAEEAKQPMASERDTALHARDSNRTEAITGSPATEQPATQLASAAASQSATAGIEREQTYLARRTHGSALPRE
jgi:Protein of unknown function (DUF3306)